MKQIEKYQNQMVQVIYFTLLTANDVEIKFPEDIEYEFITDYAINNLSAKQSIQVPISMKRRIGGYSSDRLNNSYGDIARLLNINDH